jgi:hypothetical protein
VVIGCGSPFKRIADCPDRSRLDSGERSPFHSQARTDWIFGIPTATDSGPRSILNRSGDMIILFPSGWIANGRETSDKSFWKSGENAVGHVSAESRVFRPQGTSPVSLRTQSRSYPIGVPVKISPCHLQTGRQGERERGEMRSLGVKPSWEK